MRQKRSGNMELLNIWRAELKEAVEAMDVNTFRTFAVKWCDKGVYDYNIYSKMTDEVLEISLRKMAVAMTDIDPAVKKEAETWLLERGFDLSM